MPRLALVNGPSHVSSLREDDVRAAFIRVGLLRKKHCSYSLLYWAPVKCVRIVLKGSTGGKSHAELCRVYCRAKLLLRDRNGLVVVVFFTSVEAM